jgi:hypothetical protein
MHLGLIVGEERLDNEREMLDRLVAGLVDAGDEVTRFLPETDESHASDQPEPVVSVAVPMHVPPWLAKARARQMAGAVEKTMPDLVYAIGEDAWPLGVQLAGEIERPVAIDVWCESQTRAAPKRRGAGHIGAYIAPTAPLADKLSQRVGRDLVSIVPMGVPVADTAPTPPADPERSISVAIMGPGRDMHAYTAMLTALQRVVRELPQVQAVIELREPHAHAIWREANRLDLLGNLSAITDASPLRALLTRCDVLLVPEASGEMRSLLLEAMAAGMAIVAADDPALDLLVDGVTAAVVGGRPHPEHWGSAIRRVLTSPHHAASLGREAHRRVLLKHRVRDHVHGLRGTFERIMSGGSYSFAEAGC